MVRAAITLQAASAEAWQTGTTTTPAAHAAAESQAVVQTVLTVHVVDSLEAQEATVSLAVREAEAVAAADSQVEAGAVQEVAEVVDSQVAEAVAAEAAVIVADTVNGNSNSTNMWHQSDCGT